jgi:hypothetical protein
MAKAPYKLPNVFVGCPYGGKFKFAPFKAALERIPFRFHFADTRLETKHLLEILRKYMNTADYCVFDLSTWNANVALELGLADGLDVEYYILVNRSLSKGVPADIQGIQRIEYGNLDDFDEQNGLLPKLIKYLVREQTHPRNIWNELEGTKNRAKRYYLALRVLAHFRDNKRLSNDQLTSLAGGTYLHKPDREAVLAKLGEMGLVAGIGRKKGAWLKKNIFRDPIS